MNDLNIGLPKWPALIVLGERVSLEQAQEICIRTDPWHLMTNDHAFERTIAEAFGFPYDGYMISFDALEAWRSRLGVLDLTYLDNSRIVSAWVGGPKGWCDWNGVIESRNYNIGKWPSVEEVLGDWVRIAEAFPYLKLVSQLWDGETTEADIEPVVEFLIAEGRAVARKPQADIGRPMEAPWTVWSSERTERGITIDGLREAVNVVLAKRGLPLVGNRSETAP